MVCALTRLARKLCRDNRRMEDLLGLLEGGKSAEASPLCCSTSGRQHHFIICLSSKTSSFASARRQQRGINLGDGGRFTRLWMECSFIACRAIVTVCRNMCGTETFRPL